MVIEISDNGRAWTGKCQKTVNLFTARERRGMSDWHPLSLEAARRCEGDLTIQSEPGQGTRVKAWFRHSHIDRAPLGDCRRRHGLPPVGSSGRSALLPHGGLTGVPIRLREIRRSSRRSLTHRKCGVDFSMLAGRRSRPVHVAQKKADGRETMARLKSLEELKRFAGSAEGSGGAHPDWHTHYRGMAPAALPREPGT